MSRHLKGKALEGINAMQKNKQRVNTNSLVKNALQSDIISEEHRVNKGYLGKLIGKGGSNLKRLRAETNTSIHINNETGVVTIQGTKDKIALVKSYIDKLSTKNERPTHFLSLPIQSPALNEKIKEINQFCCQENVDPETLVSIPNLHITLGVMKLLNQVEIDRALNILKEECPEVVHSVVGDTTIKVKLNKLLTMQPNPSKARVVYIEPVDESEHQVFNRLCTSIIEKMVSVGLLEKENRPFKPHVTLINTTYSRNGLRSFDATSILEKYKQVDFGSAVLTQLHLMKMGRTGPNKTYESKGFIPLLK